MIGTPRQLHLVEYGIEGWALATFMVSACLFGALVFHAASPAAAWPPLLRQGVMGVLMGLTLIALVYSPWGRRSGAQMNPAFTLTFLRLGKIAPADATGYIIAQFIGGTAGVWLSAQLIPTFLAHPSVDYVVTKPGTAGVAVAFAGEVAISLLQMLLVLNVAASARWARWTGVFAAVGVALYITFESPLSGMSMNPARSVASALVAGSWYAIWIYFAAPIAGMTLAAALFSSRRGRREVPCGKMMHATPCLFCEYVAREREARDATQVAANATSVVLPNASPSR